MPPVYYFCPITGPSCSIYIPPLYLGVVLGRVLSFLEVSLGVPVLIIGDFNNILHPYWDRFHSGCVYVNLQPTSLSKLLDEVGLRDLCRLCFPDGRQLSSYSSSHHSLSRIDMPVGSESLLPMVRKVEYLVRGILDHSPI